MFQQIHCELTWCTPASLPLLPQRFKARFALSSVHRRGPIPPGPASFSNLSTPRNTFQSEWHLDIVNLFTASTTALTNGAIWTSKQYPHPVFNTRPTQRDAHRILSLESLFNVLMSNPSSRVCWLRLPRSWCALLPRFSGLSQHQETPRAHQEHTKTCGRTTT